MIEKIYTGYPILDFLENDFVENLKKIKNFKNRHWIFQLKCQ